MNISINDFTNAFKTTEKGFNTSNKWTVISENKTTLAIAIMLIATIAFTIYKYRANQSKELIYRIDKIETPIPRPR
jgi:hypothetical protein